MSEGHKDPVRPWLPPALPREAPRAVARRGACPRGVLQAGWIFTGVTALATGAAYGLALGRGPGVAVLLTAAEYLAPFALLVALVTAILAMVRGAVWGGIFLLVLSPVVIVGARFAGAWAGDSWRGWRESVRAAAPAKAAEDGAFLRGAENQPSDGRAVDAAASALLADAMLADARKLLTVKSEAVYAAAKNDAFSRVAREPGLSEKDREAVREALRAMYRDADGRRNLK